MNIFSRIDSSAKGVVSEVKAIGLLAEIKLIFSILEMMFVDGIPSVVILFTLLKATLAQSPDWARLCRSTAPYLALVHSLI